MADILQDLIIVAPASDIFNAISTSKGLDKWWTKESEVNTIPGGIYVLNFGPPYVWKATVTKYEHDAIFELQMTETTGHAEWMNTKVGFRLQPEENKTLVSFYHSGWPEASEGYRFSAYCWAMYLRILKRYMEHKEIVPYEKRLSV